MDTVTIDAALAWATKPVGADRDWWAARLSIVRGFARWLVAFDPATEVPPADLLPGRSRRAEPYPYTHDDIAALMRAARAIPTPLKAATYQTLIGLLAVTGMRIGEVIGFDRADIDWDEGLIVVRGAKFYKAREVVLHPSTVDALGTYAKARDHHVPRPATPAFLVSTAGTRLIYKNVHCTWLHLVNHAGLKSRSPRCRPRPHDLRHRFAVTTLLGWYRDGADVEARLPQLSTYLGHLAPRDTYWYLWAAPELMALAAQRLEASEGAWR
ncbi:MAG TPA: tyrosine-type recombinase/integrase [Acidimicrobiales bacterium]|nr:tyrosine-type recombinase/integrase [Acidimicrobiales bacterium]